MIIKALPHLGKFKRRGDGARKGDDQDKGFLTTEPLLVVTTYKGSKQHQPQGAVLEQIRKRDGIWRRWRKASGRSAMLTPVPTGYERFPLLFNPIRVSATRCGRANPMPAEAHTALPPKNYHRPVRDCTLEKLFKLAVAPLPAPVPFKAGGGFAEIKITAGAFVMALQNRRSFDPL